MSAHGDTPLPAASLARPGALNALAASSSFLPRLLFGLRLASSVSLAAFITYALELPNPFWAATTAAIVCQPNLGAALQKGRFRALGTTVGALALVFLLGLFPQERVALLLCLALWCGLCGGAVVLLRNSAAYAAGLSGITAAILFADSLADPTSAFFLGVTRVSEICIGIGATAVVMLLTEPGAARLALASLMERIALNLRAGFLDTLQRESETSAMEAARRTVVKALAPLGVAIDAALGESAGLYARRGVFGAVVESLVAALVAWRNVSRQKGRKASAALLLQRDIALRLARINPAFPERQGGLAKAAALQAVADIAALRPQENDDVSAHLLVEAALKVAGCLVALMDAVVFLRTGAGADRCVRRSPLVIADGLPALVAGVRAFLSVLAVSAFWIVTAWPSGAFAMAFAVISTLIFAAFADEARTRAADYAVGVAVMAVMGSAIYFYVLPVLSGFPTLVGLLFLVYVPLGMMQVGAWHPMVFLAMSITCLPLLAIGNPIAYDPAGYFNTAFAIFAGTVVGTLFFVIVPPVGPARRASRLIRLSVRDLRRLILNRRKSDARRWPALLTRRLESLPSEASLDLGGALLALLAMGEAVLALRAGLGGREEARALEAALAALACGRLALALDRLDDLRKRFAAETPATLSQASTSQDSAGRVRIQIQLAVLTDAIISHAPLLGTRAPEPLTGPADGPATAPRR